MLTKLFISLWFLLLTTSNCLSYWPQKSSFKDNRAGESLLLLIRNKSNISRIKSYTSRTIKHIDSKSSLSMYVPLLKDIQFTFTNENHLGCLTEKRLRSGDYVRQNLEEIRLYVCHYTFFTNLEKTKDLTEFKKKFLSHLSVLLEHDIRLEILKSKFLLTMKNATSKRQLLSYVGDYIVNNQLRYISPRVLGMIPISKELTAYLQTIGYYDRSKKRSFHTKISTLAKVIDKHLRAEEKKAAIAKFTEAKHFFMANYKTFDLKYVCPRFKWIGKDFIYANMKSYGIQSFSLCLGSADSESHSDAVFNIIWANLIKDDYASAYNFIFKKNIDSQIDTLDDRARFWIAHVYQNSGFAKRSKQIYSDIINKNPINYYSALAKKELRLIDDGYTDKLLTRVLSSQVTWDHSYSKLTSKQKDHVNNYLIFTHLGNISLAFNQIMQITSYLDAKQNLNHLSYSVIKYLNKREDYLSTFKFLYRSMSNNEIEINSEVLGMLFPSRYRASIAKYSGELDPNVFLALIRQESAFNPRARSRVGARGLMQLMPATAKQVNKRVRTSALNQPSVNIQIGIKYFNGLRKKYQNNLIHTLSAYNAGEGRVKRWMKSAFKNDNPLLQVESIPFSETQNYVKLIYRNLFFYNYLFEKKKTYDGINETFSLNHYKDI